MLQASIAKSTQVLPVEYIVKTRRLILNLIFLMIIFLLQTKVLSARGVPESFADLVENVGAAVVNITTTTNVEAPVVPRGVVQRVVHLKSYFAIFKTLIVLGKGLAMLML